MKKMLSFLGHIVFAINITLMLYNCIAGGSFIPGGWDTSYYIANLRRFISDPWYVLYRVKYHHFLVYFILYPFVNTMPLSLLIGLLQLILAIGIYIAVFSLASFIKDDNIREISRASTYAFFGIYLVYDLIANALALLLILWSAYLFFREKKRDTIIASALFLLSTLSHEETALFFSFVLLVLMLSRNMRKELVVPVAGLILSAIFMYLNRIYFAISYSIQPPPYNTGMNFLGVSDIGFYTSTIGAIMVLPFFPFLVAKLGMFANNISKVSLATEFMVISSLVGALLSLVAIPVAIVWSGAYIYAYRAVHFFFAPVLISAFIVNVDSIPGENSVETFGIWHKIWALFSRVSWKEVLPPLFTFSFVGMIVLTRKYLYIDPYGLIGAIIEARYFLTRIKHVSSAYERLNLFAAIFNAIMLPFLQVHYFIHYPFLLYYYFYFSKYRREIENRILIVVVGIVAILQVFFLSPELAYASKEGLRIGVEWTCAATIYGVTLFALGLLGRYNKKIAMKLKRRGVTPRHIIIFAIIGAYAIFFASNAYMVRVRNDWVESIRDVAKKYTPHGEMVTVFCGALYSNEQFIGNHWWETYNNWITAEWRDHYVYIGRVEYLPSLRLPPYMPSFEGRTLEEYVYLVTAFDNSTEKLMHDGDIIVFRKLYVPPLPLPPKEEYGIKEISHGIYSINLSIMEAHSDEYKIYILPLCDLIDTNATHVFTDEANYTLNGYDYQVVYRFEFAKGLEMKYFLPYYPKAGNVTIEMKYNSQSGGYLHFIMENVSDTIPVSEGSHIAYVSLPGGEYESITVVFTPENPESNTFTLFYLAYSL